MRSKQPTANLRQREIASSAIANGMVGGAIEFWAGMAMCAFCAPRVMPLVLIVLCVSRGEVRADRHPCIDCAGFCLLACQELKTRHRSGIIFKERAARLAVPGRHVACFRKRKENDVEAFIHARIQATEICTHAYSAVWFGICLYHGRGGEGSLGMNTRVLRAPAESRRYITRTHIVEFAQMWAMRVYHSLGSAKGNVSSFVG